MSKEQIILNLGKDGLTTVCRLVNDSAERSATLSIITKCVVVRKLAAKLVCELAYHNEEGQRMLCDLFGFTSFEGKVNSLAQFE